MADSSSKQNVTCLERVMEILERAKPGDEIGVSTEHYNIFQGAVRQYRHLSKAKEAANSAPQPGGSANKPQAKIGLRI